MVRKRLSSFLKPVNSIFVLFTLFSLKSKDSTNTFEVLIKKNNIMKTKSFFKSSSKLVALLLVATLSLTSCNKDDDSTSDAIEEVDAVETIENSLVAESNGMSKSMETTMVYAESQNLYTDSPSLNCGQLYTESFSENYSSSDYSYNYSANCNYLLSCNAEGNAQSFNYSFSRNGNYDTPRMSSDDNVNANWDITDLDASTSNTLFNGSYVRIGSQVSKVRNMNTFNSTLTYSLNSIAVNKDTYKIASGSASVVFEGTSASGNSYTYNGTITFNGDDTATLVINGNTYTIYL